LDKQTKNNDETYSPAKTVVKALNIIEFIGKRQPVGVPEISKEMNLTRANAHRLVTTLESMDFIERIDNHKYTLSFKMYKLGSTVPVVHKLNTFALPVMKGLAELAGESVYLFVKDNNMSICIEEVTSNSDLIINREVIPLSLPLHSCGSGKLFLAYLDQAALNDCLDSIPLTQSTPNTIIQKDRLIEEAKAIRERHYSIEIQENSMDVNSVAAPIFNFTDKMVASISIAGPTARLPHNRLIELSSAVQVAAQTISRKMGYTPEI
jgi:IclR family transcriptional regulator, KDG regulon repressor